MISETFMRLLATYGADANDIYLLARQAELKFYEKKPLTFMEKAAAYACFKGRNTGWMGDNFLVYLDKLDL